jgi:magnesium-transporting ATPase (P-type)
MFFKDVMRKFSLRVAPHFHLIFGILVLIIFLVTGRFMRVDFPDKEIIPQDFRLLMRSRHIYILFSSFIHILLGVYLQIETRAWRKTLQLFGSTLLAAGSVFLVWAFVYETYTTKTFSETSRWGIYLSLGGTISHFVGAVKIKK